MRKTVKLSILMLPIICMLVACMNRPQTQFYFEKELSDYYNDNKQSLCACIEELRDAFSTERQLLQCRSLGGGVVQIKQFSSNGGLITNNYSDLPCTKKVLDDGVITLIELRDNSISFLSNFFSTYRGLVYVTSGKLEDIFGFDATMVFVPKGNGWFGRESDPSNDDNTFYYACLDDCWFYYEANY